MMKPMTAAGAEVVASVAMLQSERDTLRGLLRQVLDSTVMPPGARGDLLVLLSRPLAEEIREYVR
jgi:hypothetical protein